VLSIVFDSCNQQGTMTRGRLIRLAYISGYSALGIGYGLCAVFFILERYGLTPMGSVLNWLDRAALWPSVGLILFSWGAIGAAFTAGLIIEIRDRWKSVWLIAITVGLALLPICLGIWAIADRALFGNWIFLEAWREFQ
jgi:hypothetical protein